ncbi:MAG TPA: VCBS repeat-containing protein [bacterium]|nr:VCBS repeat-containing protein [bacterium]
MKKTIIFLAGMLFSGLIASCHCAAQENSTIQTFNFYLLERLPRKSLSNVVIPAGDDYFTAERIGLKYTLRRLVNGALEKSSTYKVLPVWDAEDPDRTAEDAFKYFIKSDNPVDYFDIEKLTKSTENIDTDLLVIGVIEELKIKLNKKFLEDEWARMKISILVFDNRENAFIHIKSYELNSNTTVGLVSESRLPKRRTRVPKDIMKFATSEVGRVFLGGLPLILEEMPGGKKTKPFLKGDYAVVDYTYENENLKKGEPQKETTPPPPSLTPECKNEKMTVAVTPGGDGLGIRTFRCKDGRYDFSYPEIETEPIFPDSAPASSIGFGDFDADGDDELFVTTYSPEEQVKIFKLNNGMFDETAPYISANDLILGASLGINAAAGDFDLDGDDELAVSATKAGDHTFFIEFNGDEMAPIDYSTQLYNIFGASGHGANIATGDFNADGRDEVIIASSGAGEMLDVYEFKDNLNSKPEIIAQLRNYFGGVSGSTNMAAGDFDRDGRDELIVASMDGGVNIRIYSYADETGFNTDVPFADLSADWGNSYTGARVAAGDFDGDGFDDLAISPIGDGGYLYILKYEHNRFILSDPYLNAARLYGEASLGIITSSGIQK